MRLPQSKRSGRQWRTRPVLPLRRVPRFASFTLLDRVRAALQSQDPDAGCLANVEAVTIEIERVKKLAGVTSPGPAFRNMQRDPRQVSLQSGRRIPPRNKGRRTMGRASGR